MKFSCLSDIHGRLDITCKPSDFLLISGDILPYEIQRDSRASLKWLVEEFMPWLEYQPAKHKIFIAGNHDFVFESTDDYVIRRTLNLPDTNIHYLNDSSVSIDGINFYGSPWTKWFWDWAFNLPKFDLDGSHATEHWAKIPDNTHVLLTHGPPSNIRDWNQQGQSCGDYELKQRVLSLPDVVLHVFGHIHEAFGSENINDILFYNAAFEHQTGPVPLVQIDNVL